MPSLVEMELIMFDHETDGSQRPNTCGKGIRIKIEVISSPDSDAYSSPGLHTNGWKI